MIENVLKTFSGKQQQSQSFSVSVNLDMDSELLKAIEAMMSPHETLSDAVNRVLKMGLEALMVD
jgi:hypothetical protein